MEAKSKGSSNDGEKANIRHRLNDSRKKSKNASIRRFELVAGKFGSTEWDGRCSTSDKRVYDLDGGKIGEVETGAEAAVASP